MSPQEVNKTLQLLQNREEEQGNDRNAKALYLAQCAVDGFFAIGKLLLSDCEGCDDCDN